MIIVVMAVDALAAFVVVVLVLVIVVVLFVALVAVWVRVSVVVLVVVGASCSRSCTLNKITLAITKCFVTKYKTGLIKALGDSFDLP